MKCDGNPAVERVVYHMPRLYSGPWLHTVPACINTPVIPAANAHEWRRESGWGACTCNEFLPISPGLMTVPWPNASVKYRLTS